MGRDTRADFLMALRGETRIAYANNWGLTPIPIVQTGLRIHSASAVE